jgi:hypothetical protein
MIQRKNLGREQPGGSQHERINSTDSMAWQYRKHVCVSQSAQTHDFHGRLAPRQQIRVVFVRTDKDDGHTAASGAIATTGTTVTGMIAIATGIMTAGTIAIASGIIAAGDWRGALREIENAQQQLDGAGRARARK